jgi:WD40 repeat protein
MHPKVTNRKTGELLSTLTGHEGEVVVISGADEAGSFCSGSEDSSIRYWKASNSTWTCQSVFEGHTGAVTCLQFCKKKIISGSSDSTIKIWSFDEECILTLPHHTGHVYCLEYNRDYLVSGSEDKSIKIFCLRQLESRRRVQCVRTLVGHEQGVVCLQFDEEKIVSGSQDRKIKVSLSYPTRF